MKLVSRMFAVLGIFVVIALVAAACGGKEPTATPPPTATNAPTATAPPAATSAPTATVAPEATATRPAPTATPTSIPATAAPTPIKPKSGGTLRIYQSRNQEGMDFHRARLSSVWVTTAPLLNWIVAYHAATGRLVPDVAQSWDVSSDGLTYTFKLDPKATWQDGAPITTTDVIYTIERIQGKKDIPNPVYASTMAPVSSLRAIDNRTLEVKLSRVSASFLAGVGIIGNMVYPASKPGPYLSNFPFVGSGPFKLQSVSPDVQNVLLRNDNYWKTDEFGTKLPYLDRIDVFIITDIAAQRSAFNTSQVDTTFQHSLAFKGRLAEVRQRFPDLQTTNWWSNRGLVFSSKSVTADPRFRKAVQLALDRDAATQVWLPGESRAAILWTTTSTASPSKWGLTEAEIRALPGMNPATKQQDIAQANSLLDDFFKSIGKTRDTLELPILVRSIYQDFGLIAQDQLKKSLGLKTVIDLQQDAKLVELQSRAEFQLNMTGISAAWDDPSDFLGSFFRTGSGLNYGAFSDPDVDAALDAIDRELDPVKRKQLTNVLERKMYDLAWVAQVVGDVEGSLRRGYVKNYLMYTNQDNYASQYERVWLDK